MTVKEMLETAVKALDSKKAQKIEAIDVTEVSNITDYFVICSASSSTHARTLADEVEEKLGQDGAVTYHKEGYRDSSWVLLDYGSLVVHVFYGESRDFYNLEHLWSDGTFLDVSGLLGAE